MWTSLAISLRMAKSSLVVTLLFLAGFALAQQNVSTYLMLVPESLDVLVGSSVIFECWVESSTRGPLMWKFNNRTWGWSDPPWADMLNGHRNNWKIYSRRFTAQREHNGSWAQCRMTLSPGQDVYSNHGVLLVRDFQEVPKSVNSTLGESVEFHCYLYFNGTSISWYINETKSSNFNSSLVSVAPDTYSLIITAQQMFNNTLFHCEIETTSISSAKALLLIQGELDAVGDLHVANSSRNSIFISWMPPFSLDITDSSPDVWYSLSILSLTGGSLPCHHCHYIIDTSYNLSLTDLTEGMNEVQVVPVNAYGRSDKSSKLLVYIVGCAESGSCDHANNSSLIPGVGVEVGFAVGVVTGVILMVVGVMCWYCLSHSNCHLSSRRKLRNEVVQHNPAYESCTPKQSPTGRGTTESLMLPGIGERGREYHSSPILDQGTVYEEIP